MQKKFSFSYKENIRCYDATKKLKFKKNNFDLVVSINVIHNFSIDKVFNFLRNITYISKNTYIATESYRNDKELFNLQCWALTAESFFSAREWKWILKSNRYFREYELIYFS